MAIIDQELKSVSDQLRGKHPHRENFLEEINLRNLRGIGDLRVPFAYPVTVLAGENACGKSTVLFGCAAAYADPDGKTRTPSILFPSFSRDNIDQMEGAELEYAYIHNRRRLNKVWRLRDSETAPDPERGLVSLPERTVYLRTLANLTNPSEVRSMLRVTQRDLAVTPVPAEFLLLSRRVLARQYQGISRTENGEGAGDLLVAQLEGRDDAYSEFHMAAGERSILRMSMEITRLKNALVLIDEVETGLHPHVQKLLLLNLQRLALRQDLQIIVTTHSPVVLNCVPPEGRIFLSRSRTTHDVHVELPMRDIMQQALYGQPVDRLSIMCEDGIAEAIIRGVVDALVAKLNFRSDQIFVGRNTGKFEFPNHVRTLHKMELLRDFAFVLDGDAREVKERIEGAVKEQSVELLFLPGNACPEKWLWLEIAADPARYETLLATADLSKSLKAIEHDVFSMQAKESEQYEAALWALSEEIQRESGEIARAVARDCAEAERGEIAEFVAALQEVITEWRQQV